MATELHRAVASAASSACLAGPPETSASGRLTISRHADTLMLLRDPDCQRTPYIEAVRSLFAAVGQTAEELGRIASLDLLSHEGDRHRQMRRYALKVAAAMTEAWPPSRIATQRLRLVSGLSRSFDLHRDVSEALVCTIFGDVLGLEPEEISELYQEIGPIFESTFRTDLRLVEMLRLGGNAERLFERLDRYRMTVPDSVEIDSADRPLLAFLVLVPTLPVLASALTELQARLISERRLAARLRELGETSGFVRDLLREMSPGRPTRPTRAGRPIALRDGTVLSEGTAFVCDLLRANNDPATAPEARPDLSFGAGAHRCAGAGFSLVVLNAVAAQTLEMSGTMELVGNIEFNDRGLGRRYLAVPAKMT